MKATNKYFLTVYSLFVVMALLATCSAFAQTGVPKSATISWVLPLKNTDGSTIDATNPITKVQVFLANAAISDNFSQNPTVELTGAQTTTTQTFTVFPGGGLFVRVKACNAKACSDFSAQASVPIPNVVPGVPTSLSIQLVIQP